jgi:ankyrin repeat protein
LIEAARLIKFGADINTMSRLGETPLHASLETGNSDLFFLLYKRKADMQPALAHERNELHVAVEKSHYRLAKLILRDQDQFANYKNMTDTNGWTPLHIASMKGDSDMVSLLIKYNAQIEVRDLKGRTPKDLAILNNHGEDILDLFEAEDFFVKTPHTTLGKSAPKEYTDAIDFSNIKSEETVDPLMFIQRYMETN